VWWNIPVACLMASTYTSYHVHWHHALLCIFIDNSVSLSVSGTGEVMIEIIAVQVISWSFKKINLLQLLHHNFSQCTANWRGVISKDLRKMGFTWVEAEVAALDRHGWRRSVAQSVQLDMGWIKVKVKLLHTRLWAQKLKFLWLHEF